MENVMEKNENLFFLTKKELNLIMLLEDIDEIPGIGVMLDDMTEEEVKESYESLQEKKIISVFGNESEWNERFIAWFDVICKAKRYLSIEGNKEKLSYFFYAQSIVSVEIRNGEISILWIPFIHLAIGQFLTFIDFCENNELLTVTSVDEKSSEALTANISIVELRDSLDLQNDITQKMVKLHAEELREDLGDQFEDDMADEIEVNEDNEQDKN